MGGLGWKEARWPVRALWLDLAFLINKLGSDILEACLIKETKLRLFAKPIKLTWATYLYLGMSKFPVKWGSLPGLSHSGPSSGKFALQGWGKG